MLKKLRKNLKNSPLIYNFYMRLKRSFKGELLGMTSKSEQDYFSKYGETLYKGKGEVVDLGCWLGSTTIPLVKGLLKNPLFIESKNKVFAYDTFIWYDIMKESVAGTDLVGKYKDGDSFLDEYKKRIAKYADHIEICEGDLAQIGWKGDDIEFLLIDAMKNWELANAILKNFYTNLIPNQSLILHQDFSHYFTPWIHLLQWYFREYFEFTEDIAASPSCVFKYIKKIPDQLLNREYSFESFSDEDCNKAFDYSLDLVSNDKKANIYAAKVMMFIHQRKFSDARKALESLAEQNIPIEKDLLVVQDLLS